MSFVIAVEIGGMKLPQCWSREVGIIERGIRISEESSALRALREVPTSLEL